MNRHRHWLVLVTLALAVVGCDDAATPPPTDSAPGLTTLAPVATTTTSQPPAATVTTEPPVLQAAPAGICRSYEDPTTLGTVNVSEVTETSGIAISRTHPDVVWMHNDSGGGPFIYATTLAGEPMGTFELGTLTFDWEDMSLGPGPEPGRDYLYIGDIGDNLRFRPVITVHRIAEPTPDPAGGTVTDVETFNLVYPESGSDAEAFFVDPITGDLVLITKPDGGGDATIFRAPAAELVNGANVNLVEIGTFPLDGGVFVTAADIDSTGSVILMRGYNQVWLFERLDISFAETFAAEPCRTPSTAEVQGEAIAFAAGGFSYYTISEGSSPDINYVFSIFD